jgi:carotenoid 1,2-hydratase
MNVALYGAAGRRWAMTERRRTALDRGTDHLAIGPSRLAWEGERLTARFDEIASPVPRRVRGEVRLHSHALGVTSFRLDEAGRHAWRPLAPRARVEVELEHPRAAWTGNGYFDMNFGSEPLEHAFRAWEWSRAHLARDTFIFYDVERREGERLRLSLRVGPDGTIADAAEPSVIPLPRTGWRMARTAAVEAGAKARVRQTLEDAPFYSRSLIEGAYAGEAAEIVHESLSLDRLRSPMVRAMLPFRMPRVLR